MSDVREPNRLGPAAIGVGGVAVVMLVARWILAAVVVDPETNLWNSPPAQVVDALLLVGAITVAVAGVLIGLGGLRGPRRRPLAEIGILTCAVALVLAFVVG